MRGRHGSRYKPRPCVKKNLSEATLMATRGLGHTRILKDEEVIKKCVSFLASPTTGVEFRLTGKTCRIRGAAFDLGFSVFLAFMP